MTYRPFLLSVAFSFVAIASIVVPVIAQRCRCAWADLGGAHRVQTAIICIRGTTK